MPNGARALHLLRQSEYTANQLATRIWVMYLCRLGET
jgi:hypothetical protein